MPKLADFMESLTQEQDKLVRMGTIKPSKEQAFVDGDSMPFLGILHLLWIEVVPLV